MSNSVARALRSAAVLAVLAGASPAAAADKLNLGVGFAIDHLPVYVAQEKGIFKKHGLDVELKKIPVPANIYSALASGDLDIGAASGISIFQGREAGLNFVVVTGETRNDRNNVTTGLVTRKGGPAIKKPDDMKGMKVGIAGLQSGNYIFLAKWLLDGKVPLKDVTFIEMPTPRMGDMLKTGNVDAVILPDPLRMRIVQSGVGELSVPVPTEVNPDSPNIFWAAMEEWAKKNPETIKKFRAAFAEAVDYVNKNNQEAREIEKKQLPMVTPDWPTWSVKVTDADVKFLIDMGRELGMLKQDMKPSEIMLP